MSLEDTATRHQVFLQRYATGLARRFGNELFDTYQAVLDALDEVDVTSARAARLATLQLDIEQLLSSSYDASKVKMMGELAELAEAEIAFSSQLLSANTSINTVVPAVEQVTAAYMVKKFEASPRSMVSLESAVNNFGKSTAAGIKRAVKDGIVMGETNVTIANNIRRQQVIAKRHADTIARTATNHVSNVARSETYHANADIVTGYEWLATLDSRTTLVCASRDGIVYTVSDESPKPPAHFNCRSTTVPVIDPEYDVSPPEAQRQARGKDGKRQKVKANTTYGQWLKKQPASFQNEYFSKFKNGDEKAKLFRRGGLPIDKFVDANGAEYSLDQLKSLNPLEFDKAGL